MMLSSRNQSQELWRKEWKWNSMTKQTVYCVGLWVESDPADPLVGTARRIRGHWQTKPQRQQELIFGLQGQQETATTGRNHSCGRPDTPLWA